ncbi:MAG: hypothetical protein ABS46_01410 [Cytophagaceae bacterium SCN 52-12]|nr:MAG: hypothetical protein ABS46_01410 [Cytophagaceae bacterium SCN 52-12]
MELKSLDDVHLVVLLRNDNAPAFKELYERYWYYTYHLALKKTGRADVAQEMAQQLFETLWDKRDRLRIDNFKAYLTSSLKHLVIDYIRRHILEASYLEKLRMHFSEAGVQAGRQLEYDELAGTVTELLHQLPRKTRQVFIMRRFEYYTIPEIARELNLSEKAIEYHLTKALSFLRKHLKEYMTLVALGILS